jgi:plastocyanin
LLAVAAAAAWGVLALAAQPPSGSGSSGGPGGSGQGYGTRDKDSKPAREGRTEETDTPPSKPKDWSRLLRAAGVPVQDGKLRWPVALQVLASPETDDYELRDQIDALFEEVADQASQGAVNPELVREMGRVLKKFRARVFRDRPERYALSRSDWDEAEKFVDKLDRATRLFQAGFDRPAGEASLSTKGREEKVTLRDDVCDPSTITVPVGTTVRWGNEGRHTHTVTGDDGNWGSAELAPGDSYRHTFTRTGEYHYHCENHPREMRGIVKVK